MITKKRYLELKKRRKQLHFTLRFAKRNLSISKRKYDKELNENKGYFVFKSMFEKDNERHIALVKEYNLITELIDSTKELLSIKYSMESKRALVNHIQEHMKLAKNDTILDTHQDHVKMYHEMGGFS